MTALDTLSADLKHHAMSNGIEIKKRYLVSNTTTAAATAPVSSTNSDASVQSQKQSPLQYKTTPDRRNVANESHLIQKQSTSSSSSINTKSTFASTFIYPYLLELILFVLRLVQLVRLYAVRIYYFVSEWHDATGTKPSSSSKFILAPSHVCVILNETVTESSAVNDLVDRFSLIVNVMSAHGSRLVSFYAYQQLDAELIQKLLRICSEKSDPNNNDTNYAQVKLVTSNDVGKNLLVEACRMLARQVKSNQLEIKQIKQELLDKTILELSKMSEPELVVSIGEQDTLAGFSPWHIRLSEIIKIPSYKLINKSTINQLLERYEKIEKRFGK